jgi:hypothetical protein
MLLAGCVSGGDAPTPPSEQDDMAAPRIDSGVHDKPGSGNVGELGVAGRSPRDSGMSAMPDASDEEPDASDAGCKPTGAEHCNLRDDDCDGKTDEGFDLGMACDGDDADQCANGVTICDGNGGVTCGESGKNVDELCDGADNDCDGKTDEGYALGGTCDGADADHCADGVVICDGAKTTRCSDDDVSALDTCNGVDDDCNPATPDGSDEATVGQDCDGDDSDLCAEGTIQCTGSKLGCSDTTGDDLELCNGQDDDCNPATADGADESELGMQCDGDDSDFCLEGTYSCSNGGLKCSDATSSTVETCNGQDDDCDDNVDESSATCSSATALGAGSVRGDVNNDTLTITGHADAWYSLRVADTGAVSTDPNDPTSTPYLSATIDLSPGAGTDYDLEVYCTSCAGALAGSSDIEGTDEDFVDVRKNDGAADDSFSVLVHVVYFEASACSDWTLSVQSNTTVTAPTCN